jgi:hypothetical protein
MSKIALSLALVASLSSVGSAQQFAKAPAAPGVDRGLVRDSLAMARAANIAAFHAYVAARVYPSNTTSDKTLNVWRDKDGHLCAAATIIDRSGEHDLVKHVAETDNNLRLATITDGPIESWILESGLTQEELVTIQKPFNPVSRVPNKPVDPDMRSAETARLGQVYAQIEKQLTAEQDAALDTATDRVMAHPELVAALVAGNPED